MRTPQVSHRRFDPLREAKYIVRLAVRREPRVVSLGQIVFFSTASGDAWMLDPGDGLARCLARDGEPLPIGVRETAESFAIAWDLTYRIEGGAMVFTDSSGSARTVLGYPTSEIEQAANRARRLQ